MLKLWFERAGISFESKILRTEQGKKAELNGKVVKLESDYINHVFSLIFSPDILSSFKGQPQSRRRFFDRFFSMVDPGYMVALKKYRGALQQKNALLKMKSTSSLDAWDKVISECILEIINKRFELIDKINQIYERMNMRHPIILKYESAFQNFIGGNVIQIGDFIISKRNREIQSGCVLYGVHRDDLFFSSQGRDCRNFLSQGEYRRAFLNLLLASNQYMQDKLGFSPLLLFDDALSELDSSSTKSLLDDIEKLNNQIFFTGVERNPLMDNYEKFELTENSINHFQN